MRNMTGPCFALQAQMRAPHGNARAQASDLRRGRAPAPEAVAAHYPGARVVRLMTSYRSTCEIVELAARVMPVAGLVAVQRHGEAVLLDVDGRQYATEADRNLLYVAVTRAMHALTVLYRDEPSPLLGEERPR